MHQVCSKQVAFNVSGRETASLITMIRHTARLLTQHHAAKASGNTRMLSRSLAIKAEEGPDLTLSGIEGQSAQEGFTSRELDLNYRQVPNS